MQTNISSEDKLEFLVSISNMTFLSLSEKKLILQNVDDAVALSKMTTTDISHLIFRTLKTKFDAAKNYLLAKRATKVISSLDITTLQYDDIRYPAMLREIHDAPFLLYCRGDISCLRQKSISIVGTREITSQGRTVAQKFAKDAATKNYTVISGLAYGVDGEAHKGAIEAYYDALEVDESIAENIGKTCAVLPGGVDEIVPYGHKKLAQKIVASGGLLISECPPCVPVEKWRFVSRNRIIAALSPVTVIVEAPPASGALLTAEFALGYSRDIAIMETAFCEDAKKISLQKQKKLALQNTQKKRITTLDQYVSDGASIIKNFQDYENLFS